MIFVIVRYCTNVTVTYFMMLCGVLLLILNISDYRYTSVLDTLKIIYLTEILFE